MNFTTLLLTILCASHVCSHVIHRRQADADPTNDLPTDNDGAVGATGGDGEDGGSLLLPGNLQPITYTHDTGPDGLVIPGSNRTVIPDFSTANPETTDDGSNGGGVTDLPGDSGYGSGDSGYGSGDSGYGSGDSGYGSGDSGYGSGDSGYGPGDSGYGSGDSGYGPGDSGYGPGDSGYGPGDSGYGPGDSGYGPGDSGYEPGDSGYEPGDSGFGPGNSDDAGGAVPGHTPSGGPLGNPAPRGW